MATAHAITNDMMLNTGGTSGAGIKRKSTRAGAAPMAIRLARPWKRSGISITNLPSDPLSLRAIETLHVAGLSRHIAGRSLRRGRARLVPFRIGAPLDMGIRIDWVVVLRGYSPEADGLPHQAGNAFGLHLLHDLSAIAINSSHANVKLGRDGVAGESVRYQIENLDLARRQPGKSSVKRALRSLQIQVFEAPGKRAIDRCNQLPVVNRLFDEVLCSRLDRCDRHWNIGVT